MKTLKVTDGIELRPFEVTDSNLCYEIIVKNRIFLEPWLPWIRRTHSVSDLQKRFEWFLEKMKTQEAANLGIWHSNKIVGGIGYFGHDPENHLLEIGFWIIEDAQGKGIATASCKVLQDYLFDEVKINRIEMRCSPQNERSQAVANRLGYSLEGTIRENLLINGLYQDLLLYSLLKRERKPIGDSS